MSLLNFNKVEVKAFSVNCQHVFDDNHLLSKKQEKKLETMAKKYGKKGKFNFIIVTTNYSTEKNKNSYDPIQEDTWEYSENFNTSLKNIYGDKYGKYLILVINITDSSSSATRYADICGYDNLCTGATATTIFKSIVGDLSDDDYYTACKKFIKIGYKYVK